VLVFDSSLDHQHSTIKKFAPRWFGPYVVIKVHQNATYGLRELDGTHLKIPIAGHRVKIFRKREGTILSDCLFDGEEEEEEEEERNKT
jgi:hypothetical protein